jgi:EAL and modified HD-GYP domain-containing signal transduction protein
MAGMFSMLGTLFGMPIEEVLRPLMISDAMRAAVLTRGGELGQLLTLIETAESGDFLQLSEALHTLQVSHEDFNLMAVQACDWMLGVIRESVGKHG